MTQLLFYIRYAFRNIWRSRRWSAFAILSVTAGVATVVALRSLGLAIDDSLTSNIRSSNHGDITLIRGSFNINLGAPENFNIFSTQQVASIRQWVEENDAQHTEYTSTNTIQVAPVEAESVGALQFLTSLFIDPETYPPTDDIVALEPEGVPLGELFQGGNEIVISDNFAAQQRVEVGDRVRVGGTTEEFIVRGIVPTESEAGLRDVFAAFFGFVYFDRDLAEALSVTTAPNRISIMLPGTPTNDEILAAADNLNQQVGYQGGRFRMFTVPRLLEQNAFIADWVGRFVVVMGLGAMLLGGVGIINPMLVMVRRRTEEIAALKTFGLKGRQVALLFMTEALLLGIIGSVFGAIFGSLLSFFTNAYGETFIQQPLTWRIYPEALGFGIVLGMIVTGVFGVMPVLTALRVRPNVILRPNAPTIPRASILQSLFAMLFVVVSLGLVAGQIIGPIPENPMGIDNVELGLVGVTVTLIILALLVGLLWILVWIISRLPSFGLVELRLALRNLTTRRIRTSTTLLALSAGMFALSSITFVGAGVREILTVTLEESLGGNVLVASLLPDNLSEQAIDSALEQTDGINYTTHLTLTGGSLQRIDDITRNDIATQQSAAIRAGDTAEIERLNQILDTGFGSFLDTVVRDTDNPNAGGGNLIAGRTLTLEDRGQFVAVVRYDNTMALLGAQIGSEIEVRIEGRPYTFEIIGFVADDDGESLQSALLGDLQLPPDVIEADGTPITVLQVEDENVNEVLVSLSSVPLMFPLDVAFFDNILSRFIEQFSALPLLVGMLSLGAAAVMMANTVALATLERRRQIGILKAVGLKGRRVLRIMLLENILVSLLGGVIGIGLSALGVTVLTYFGLGDAIPIPQDAMPVAVALVVAAVVIGGVATILSANVAVRERVLNVLRYE